MKRVLVVLIAMGLTCLGGCGEVVWKGGGIESRAVDRAWPFLPETIRIHPFTSIAFDPNAEMYVIEARVELLDRVGDTTKGVGDFRFEMYRGLEGGTSGEAERELLSIWSSSISSFSDNAAHYDGITRTYWFRLEMHEPLEDRGNLFLVALFTDAGGRRMSAESVLSLSGSGLSETD